MAKFLNTSGVSFFLEELIKNTNSKLILISPYLQLSDRIKEHLMNLNSLKKDIRIVYRENKLQIEENNWMESQIGIRTSLCKNLHAKCYINEKEAIITSMNLYEFSMQNNNEMGIYISKEDDPQLYSDALKEAERLLTISEEIRVSVKKVAPEAKPKQVVIETPKTIFGIKISKQKGFCIRSGISIPFNIEKPMSAEAFKTWSKYEDPDYPEKYCHFSGEPSNGETSLAKPILKKNWKKAKEIFDL